MLEGAEAGGGFTLQPQLNISKQDLIQVSDSRHEPRLVSEIRRKSCSGGTGTNDVIDAVAFAQPRLAWACVVPPKSVQYVKQYRFALPPGMSRYIFDCTSAIATRACGHRAREREVVAPVPLQPEFTPRTAGSCAAVALPVALAVIAW